MSWGMFYPVSLDCTQYLDSWDLGNRPKIAQDYRLVDDYNLLRYIRSYIHTYIIYIFMHTQIHIYIYTYIVCISCTYIYIYIV